jgi:calcineurin-like phosphoesterase family protein
MSKVRFIADLHFGHKKCADQRHAASIKDHDEWLIDRWNSVVTKRDLTFVLGDVTMDQKSLPLMKKLKGNKQLVMGNHDTFANSRYLLYFNKLHGLVKYKGFWLSHAPIKESSLRGHWNIHGHTHSECFFSPPYVCVSVEALRGRPISFEEIVGFKKEIDNIIQE